MTADIHGARSGAAAWQSKIEEDTDMTINKTSEGNMVINHVNETIMEVFEVTGFSDILTIR